LILLCFQASTLLSLPVNAGINCETSKSRMKWFCLKRVRRKIEKTAEWSQYRERSDRVASYQTIEIEPARPGRYRSGTDFIRIGGGKRGATDVAPLRFAESCRKS
jgi:hypothetical protein